MISRDLFKIRLPCASWVDAFVRVVSPPRKEKPVFVKADPNMEGHLVAMNSFCPATVISVSGNLATGWGELMVERKPHKCYKSTPGDVITTPLEVMDMPFWVPLYLTTGSRPAAGRLYTHLDLSAHCENVLTYHAAGMKTYLKNAYVKMSIRHCNPLRSRDPAFPWRGREHGASALTLPRERQVTRSITFWTQTFAV